jgi:hypothetical protein
MFISLRESSSKGFKRWSDSQQPKHSDRSGANEDNALVAVVAGPDISALAAIGRSPKPSPLIMASSL